VAIPDMQDGSVSRGLPRCARNDACIKGRRRELAVRHAIH